jgi:hypothetical protein
VTVSDMLAPPAPAAAETKGGDARARVRESHSVTDGDRSSPSWLVNAKTAVVADWRGAWLWDAHGITVRNLWETRVPHLDDVPAANRGLWIAWCVYNHVALLLLVPLLFTAWMLAHPARLIYAAPIAAPLTLLWLT